MVIHRISDIDSIGSAFERVSDANNAIGLLSVIVMNYERHAPSL